MRHVGGRLYYGSLTAGEVEDIVGWRTLDYIGRRSVGETEYNLRLSGGRILSCLAVGNEEDRPILYLPRIPGSCLADEAARRLRLRCYAVDRPGFGASTFQADRSFCGYVEM